MNFNWGTGITLFFSLFVVILVTTVVRTTYHDHSLVMDKYYEADLKYQEQYDKLRNTQALAEDIKIEKDVKGETLSFHFPKGQKNISGEILLFKPDDKTKDKKVTILTDSNNVFTIPVSGLPFGKWRIKVDWQNEGKGYYKEVNINL